MQRASRALGLILVFTCVLLPASRVGGAGIIQPPPPPPTPGWDTKANHQSDPNYYQPSYPIVFVKAPVSDVIVSVCIDNQTTCTNLTLAQCVDSQGHDREWVQLHQGAEFNDHLGADVVSATNPGAGNELWIYLPPNGQVKKLFPRAIHQTQGTIDFAPSVGSVVEPSLSEDGTKVYFSYFQDATEAEGTEVKNSESVPLSGADMYAIDIGPLLSNPLWSPDSLHVTRLTTRSYATGTHQQVPADRDKDAMNPSMAAATTGNKTKYGTVYLHPTEVRTRTGLHLAYVSNKRRLDNSNDRMFISNYNLNLHLAWLNPDGTLGPEDNQFEYYTTTSALSPTPLREGLAFSYQATTDDNRYWHIQKLDAEGRWSPLTGYGHGDQLFHLGTFCVGDSHSPLHDPDGDGLEDYFVALKYYNINNESFGSLWKQDLDPSVLGKNTYNNSSGAGVLVPRQDGATELTIATGSGISLSHDEPSPWDPTTNNYFGKLSTPHCGGVNELYFAYTRTSANSKSPDRECKKRIFRSHIGFRPNLQPWTPGRTVANNGHYTVIKRTNDDFNLLWPVPIVSWNERSNGDTYQQATTDKVTKPTPHIDPGEPFAIVGTSALWNTDRRPPECRYQGQNPANPTYFHPFGITGSMNISPGNQHDQLMNNQDVWTQWYSDPFCGLPPSWSILGIAINITGNRTDMSDFSDYQTSPGPINEAVRQLGVYTLGHQGEPDMEPNNPVDQSFKALIPSHVPFEFQALEVAYGMKLADVRSWHSLKPRETRTNCGGCHQHDKNASAVPFDDKYAAIHPPVDLVKSAHAPTDWSRKAIRYGANCQVTIEEHTTATDGYPEWAEIRQGMQAYCVSCHKPGEPGATPSALAAVNLNMTDLDLYNSLVWRGFASTQRGALGSQLFWAARGERTDGRPNGSPQFSSDYTCAACGGDCTDDPCDDPTHRWGFHYAAVHDHDVNNGKTDCSDGNQDFADWVFKVGKWIDNHMPRNVGSAHPYGADWYHPTADFALATQDCAPTSLRVGWWDDSGSISVLKVRLNDQEPPINPNPTQVRANGNTIVTLPSVSLTDWITVEVRDGADNRQIYRKRVSDLDDDCDDPTPP